MKKLEGYKTYILVVLIIIISTLKTQGIIGLETAGELVAILLSLLAYTIRSGMKTESKKLENKLQNIENRMPKDQK